MRPEVQAHRVTVTHRQLREAERCSVQSPDKLHLGQLQLADVRTS